MLLTNGTEEVEALMARDVLLRAGLEVDLMNIDNETEIVSSHQVLLKVLPYSNEFDKYDALMIPGGKRGVINIDNSSAIDEILDHFINHHKLIGAICAAPSILGKRGYLENKKYTCYPGWEKEEYGIYTGKEVEKDVHLITGRSVNYTSKYALEIINHFLGPKEKKRIQDQINGIK